MQTAKAETQKKNILGFKKTTKNQTLPLKHHIL